LDTLERGEEPLTVRGHGVARHGPPGVVLGRRLWRPDCTWNLLVGLKRGKFSISVHTTTMSTVAGQKQIEEDLTISCVSAQMSVVHHLDQRVSVHDGPSSCVHQEGSLQQETLVSSVPASKG